jgi:hypothetical protein
MGLTASARSDNRPVVVEISIGKFRPGLTRRHPHSQQDRGSVVVSDSLLEDAL